MVWPYLLSVGLIMTLDDFISQLAERPVKEILANLDPARIEGSAVHSRDNLLQTLLREYTQAQTNLDQVTNDHGEDSPIADLARSMRDSAKASVETRLAELKLKTKDFPELRPLYHKDAAAQDETLETARRLKARKEEEACKKHREQEQRKRENAELASDAVLAFLLLAWFSRRNKGTGQLAPFIDVSFSFSQVSGQRQEQRQ